MNAASSIQPLVWSRSRWITTGTVILVGQLILVFVLSAKVAPPSPPASPTSRFSLLTFPPAGAGDREGALGVDPAQLALVNARGFTGPVWRRLPKFGPDTAVWAEPPRWLASGPQALVGAVGKDPAPAAQPSLAGLNRPQPATVSNPVVQEPLQSRSVVRVEGQLARRPWLNAKDPPSWPGTEVLQPTTIQITVDRDGSVLSATFLTRSGLAAADEWALAQGRSARFEPAADAKSKAIAWGRLVFQWRVVPPPGSPS